MGNHGVSSERRHSSCSSFMCCVSGVSYINGLMHDCGVSIANAMEIVQSSSKLYHVHVLFSH